MHGGRAARGRARERFAVGVVDDHDLGTHGARKPLEHRRGGWRAHQRARAAAPAGRCADPLEQATPQMAVGSRDEDALGVRTGCGRIRQARQDTTRSNALTSSAAMGFHGAMPRVRSLIRLLSIVSLVAFGAFLVASVWLGRLERGGAPHMDLSLDGEIPATLFLPGSGPATAARRSSMRRRPTRGPPVVVVAHGFSSDRASLSPLARALAGAGFAVLISARPARSRREPQPYPGGRGREDFLASDFAAAVDFLPHLAAGRRLADRRDGPLDGRRSGARFCDARFRPRRGGGDLLGRREPARPAASAERAPSLRGRGYPERVKTRTAELAARLAGDAQPATGQRYGDFRQGSLGQMLASFKAGIRFFSEETYSGAPAKASADLGERILDTLAGHAAVLLTQLLDGELQEAEWHSPVWKLRHLFVNPAAVRLADAWLGVPRTVS